jgi:hypothetical protein
MASGAPPVPGTVYTFPLANGMHGACRVLRGPGAGEEQRAGHTLVCATKWVGEPAAALKHPDTKKIAKTKLGTALYWLAGSPPSTFTAAGDLPVAKADLAKKSSASAPWDILANVALAAWKEHRDPEGSAAEARANVQQGMDDLKAEVDALAARERIDLTGFVGLPKPRAEREPGEVLRWFIAAMSHWERECARIRGTEGGAAVVHFNGAALAAIFEEFCTPRERPQGRAGMFTIPPEYDPADEVGQPVVAGPRRVEIETVRRAGREARARYVLLNVRGAWLVDSKTTNGNKATL